MAITKKAALAGAINILDYSNAYQRLQEEMRRLEQRYGGVYDIQLKHPLKDPRTVTPREARRGLERIDRIMKYAEEGDITEITKSPEMIAVTKPTKVTGGGRAIPAKTIESIHRQYIELTELKYEEDVFYTKYGELVMGYEDMQQPTRDIPAVNVASQEAGKRLMKSLDKRIKYMTRYEPGEGSSTSKSAFEKRLLETVRAFPDEVSRVMWKYKSMNTLSTLSLRFSAYYRREYAKNVNGWKTFWYSSEQGDLSNMTDLLELFGATKAAAEQIENAFINHDSIFLNDVYGMINKTMIKED